ncbi:KTSC domain-containing protein [Mucilaginibacter lutimaris]|uniref:KTSC domain-containing protein n=1 Tax=Mucilaginibacter lutimaris TaxID=931629 RepID=A0ABW2ZHF5_9SPHI
MRRRKVQSTALQSIGYDPDKHILELEFRDNGGVWQYFNVKPAAYKKFVNSESLGNFFVTRIKGKYPEEKVEYY